MPKITEIGFEHRHDGYDFSILDEYGVPEEKEKKIDPILQISESYLKSLEEWRRIQSRTVDNYLRIQWEHWTLNFETGKTEIEDRVTQRQRPQ
jgi:hypothetical protein